MTTITVPKRTAHDPEPHRITFPTQADVDAYQRRLDDARRAFYAAYFGTQTPQTATR